MTGFEQHPDSTNVYVLDVYRDARLAREGFTRRRIFGRLGRFARKAAEWVGQDDEAERGQLAFIHAPNPHTRGTKAYLEFAAQQQEALRAHDILVNGMSSIDLF